MSKDFLIFMGTFVTCNFIGNIFDIEGFVFWGKLKIENGEKFMKIGLMPIFISMSNIVIVNYLISLINKAKLSTFDNALGMLGLIFALRCIITVLRQNKVN